MFSNNLSKLVSGSLKGTWNPVFKTTSLPKYASIHNTVNASPEATPLIWTLHTLVPQGCGRIRGSPLYRGWSPFRGARVSRPSLQSTTHIGHPVAAIHFVYPAEASEHTKCCHPLPKVVHSDKVPVLYVAVRVTSIPASHTHIHANIKLITDNILCRGVVL